MNIGDTVIIPGGLEATIVDWSHGPGCRVLYEVSLDPGDDATLTFREEKLELVKHRPASTCPMVMQCLPGRPTCESCKGSP